MKLDRFRFSLLAVVLFACLAWPAAAADLGGTAWDLAGTAKTKVKKVGREKMSLPTVTLSFFEDNTCVLSIEAPMSGPREVSLPGFDIGCTWSSRKGRRFTVDFDDEDLEAALSQLFQYALGLSPDGIDITTEKAKGKVSRDMDRIKLKVGVKGMVQATLDGSPVERKAKLKLVLTGTPAD